MQSLEQFALLKKEVLADRRGERRGLTALRAKGFRAHMRESAPVARAYAAAEAFAGHDKKIYCHDLVLGSIAGLEADIPDSVWQADRLLVESWGENTFKTNKDHFAPNYEKTLRIGIPGIREELRASAAAHRTDSDAADKLDFLRACTVTLDGFTAMITGYAEAAEKKASETDDAEAAAVLKAAAENARVLTDHAPRTFRQALQLMWFIHLAFQYEARYAMALGRIDQYLYPFYGRDIAEGILTHDDAVALLRCVFIRLNDDVVNIAIAGVKPEDGTTALNDLSYAVLEAVRDCNIPGPNLSARLHDGIDQHFLDECLKVIGTGLGYPALMNDEMNIPSLYRHGYTLYDSRNYCMVGCIENFMQGKQPPWSDGRFNVPRYIEAVFTRGYSMLTGEAIGVDTGELPALDTMDKFMEAYRTQLRHAADSYVMFFKNENERYDRRRYSQPFISLFCDDCIARAKDIRDGGAVYPSVHGAGCVGIASVADSLAAIEKLVYVDKLVTLEELGRVLAANYDGYEDLRKAALAAPKYGNDDDFVDKYAVWYVEFMDSLFLQYRTYDGGYFYIGIASNTQNISAGHEVAATPDGRLAREALSDAASPMHGLDKHGPTAVAASCSKPDYRRVSLGTVLNQKYSPVVFTDENLRAKLRALITVYFRQGGQEMQINSVSRSVLKAAMDDPSGYEDLVVRVSGFSAFYTQLARAVQEDILKRTEHGD